MARASRAVNGGQALDGPGAIRNWVDLVRRLDTAVDPFGSVRVSEYQPIFSIQPINISVINDRTFTSGSAAVTLDGREYKLSTPGGETCRLETGQRGRYQPGLIGVPGIGARRTTAPTGTTVYRIGYFDADDGFGIKEDANGLHTFVRRGGSEVHSTPQSQWLDPLDGTGPSGRTFDFTDGNIFRLPFLWYGYGGIELGIVMSSNTDDNSVRTRPDEPITIDRYAPSGSLSINTPNLPITAEIEGDSAGELFVGGRQYGVFGSINFRRRLTGELRTGQSVSTTLLPLVSARVRQTDPFTSIPIQVEGVSLFTDASLDWVIILGGTLTDASWAISQFSGGDTSVEYDTSATAISGGEIIAGPAFVRGGGGSNIGSESDNIPSQDVPVGEPVTLAAKTHSGTATVRSALRVAELR